MSTTLNDVPRRVETLEENQKGHGTRLTDVEKAIEAIRTDVSWIKILLVGVFLEVGFVIFQIATQ